MSRHTHNCATAMRPGCECPCLGARHGLDGRLIWAVSLSADIRLNRTPSGVSVKARARQAAAKKRLTLRTTQAKKSTRSQGKSKSNTTAALEYARTVVMVQWLIEHPTELSELRFVVDQLITASEKLLTGTPEQKKVRAALMLDHLWCDLLASIAYGLEHVAEVESHTKKKLAEVVSLAAMQVLEGAQREALAAPTGTGGTDSHRSRGEGDEEADTRLERAVLEGCIQAVVRGALDSATSGFDAGLTATLTKIRIAALMLCPDVDAHDLVWDHCWIPLWHDAILDATLEKFAEAVPSLKQETSTTTDA
jgi:hypothetical protein